MSRACGGGWRWPGGIDSEDRLTAGERFPVLRRRPVPARLALRQAQTISSDRSVHIPYLINFNPPPHMPLPADNYTPSTHSPYPSPCPLTYLPVPLPPTLANDIQFLDLLLPEISMSPRPTIPNATAGKNINSTPRDHPVLFRTVRPDCMVIYTYRRPSTQFTQQATYKLAPSPLESHETSQHQHSRKASRYSCHSC